MRSTIAHAARSASRFALAAMFSTALVAGAVAPAAAHSAAGPDWQSTVSHRLDANIRTVAGVSEAARESAAAVVAAHFDAEGRYIGSTLEQPTGNRVLDHEAGRAVSTVNYPLLPASLRGTPRTVPMEVFFSSSAKKNRADTLRAVSHRIAAKYNDNNMAAIAK